MAADTQGMAKTSIDEVPLVYLEKPYYTAPINKGEKVDALLREAPKETGKAGLKDTELKMARHLVEEMSGHRSASTRSSGTSAKRSPSKSGTRARRTA